jgi:RNA polymerase sigma-70 factor (ECF subfamily)
MEYQGKEPVKRWFVTIAFGEDRRYRLVPTRANGQPAFGVYLFSPLSRVARAFGLIVLTLVGDRVSVITAFESGAMTRFGLPRSVSRPR